MTREEAIYILRNTAWLAPSLEPIDEAIYMAIKALEEPTSKDLKKPNNNLQGWIPCSERLPEPLEEVMITWVNNSPPSYYGHMKGVPQTDEAVYFCGDWYWWDSTIVDVLGEYGKMRGIEPIKGIDITAWMPLPEPYSIESDGVSEEE